MPSSSWSNVYASFIRNSRPRRSPNRGRNSSRYFHSIWYRFTGRSRYEGSSAATSPATTSSCVGPRSISRSCRSVSRNSVSPYRSQRPVAFHGSDGSRIGIRISCAPVASISSRTIRSILRIDRSPSGSVV
jgi:hypothetical protein